jgi:hypothetical protein
MSNSIKKEYSNNDGLNDIITNKLNLKDDGLYLNSNKETNIIYDDPLRRKTSSNSDKTTTNSLYLPWDRFSNWIDSIMVVTFDIEMGQSIESIYPSAMHANLTNVDKTNICYMCFPDSNSGFIGDTQFHFRFKLDNSFANNANNNNNSNFLNPNLSKNLDNRHNRTCSNLANINNNKFAYHNANHNVNYDEYNCKTLSGLEVNTIKLIHHKIQPFIQLCN